MVQDLVESSCPETGTYRPEIGVSRPAGGHRRQHFPDDRAAREPPEPRMTAPVTVSIHRVVSPDRVPEVTAWVQTGVQLANRWDGFLGSGWVRSAEGSSDWYMLYRFADAERLAAWEDSAERRAW